MATKQEKATMWQSKDRLYELKGNKIPPVYILKSRAMYWFDEELGMEREMKGPQRLGHIVFRNGKLLVEKEQVILQKFLSIYHPKNNLVYEEYNAEQIAENDIDILELQLEAMNTAKALEVDRVEAVLRTEYGSDVTKMTSKELKRDVLIFAQNNPEMFLELVNDENINIRNIGIKAVEQNIIKLSEDQRTFKWGSNGRKLITVPFDENPYSALAAYFKTDDGIEVYQTVEKKLK